LLDLSQESVAATPFSFLVFLHIIKDVVSLHRVFHSIRFKVNKGLGLSGVPFFFDQYLDVSSFLHTFAP
jgi:hypothetical protein